MDILDSNELIIWSSNKAHNLITNCIENVSFHSSDIETINLEYEPTSSQITLTYSSCTTINDNSEASSYEKFNHYSTKTREAKISIFQIKEIDEEEKIDEDISPGVIEWTAKDDKENQKFSLHNLNNISLTHSITLDSLTLDSQNTTLLPNETYISVDDPRNQLPVEDLVH